MIHTPNLIRTFHNVKMSNRTFKIIVMMVVCSLLVSQSALAWSLWDWLLGKNQQPTTTMKPQVQSPQPKASPTIVSDCGKQADEAAYYKKLSEGFQKQSKAWHKEFELAMNYARGLESASLEKARLYNLCNNYIYPPCPSNTVKLELACSGSMLPSLHCSYPDIHGFNPNVYPYYNPQICDIINFDVFPPVKTKTTDGKSIEAGRVIHRIIAKSGSNYVTRGDAADKQDDFQPNLGDVRYVYCR